MSMVYCDPKSRMRIFPPTALLHPVVGGFLGDDHVVYVALAQSRRRDLQETRPFLQLRDVACPHVPHPGLQAPHELEDDAANDPRLGTRPSIPSGTSLLSVSMWDWKYRSLLPFFIASSDPIPRYTFYDP